MLSIPRFLIIATVCVLSSQVHGDKPQNQSDLPDKGLPACVISALKKNSVAGSSPQAAHRLVSLAHAAAGHSEPSTTSKKTPAEQLVIDQAHAACFAQDPFPSAKTCKKCHPGHYREWSVSPHAYAQLSPVFNAMSNRLIQITNGTLGDFCIRCHTPVGMALNEPINMTNLDRHPSAREGVTCIVCHRINQEWGKVSGRQALVAGNLSAPIYGPVGNDILENVLSNPEEYGVLKTSDNGERARTIHSESIPFFQQTTSGFCGSCHDVFAPNGFRLEDAFSEYKDSPAARDKGQSCQDCHMGKQHGSACGYDFAPAAKVGNKFTTKRKRSNHMMMGPDYSIVHPAFFPHNPDAIKETHVASSSDPEQGLATLREWLLFEHQQGWGTPEFENQSPDPNAFPEPWKDPAVRIRARDIIDEQFKLLHEAEAARHQVLITGYRLGRIELDKVDRRGIKFRIKVWNGTDGHGVPSGFDAERLLFLRVTVQDRCGKIVYTSGDLDPNGDVRDSHSFYVHNGLLPLDRDLFSLQTRFITRNIRGGEREQILAAAYSLDPLPYIRPATRPFTVLGRPLGSRKHKQNLEVGGERWAHYTIDRSNLTGRGPYFCQVQMISGMVPVNLIQAIAPAGFEYGLSAKEVARRVVEGHTILHTRSAFFRVDK